MWKLFLALQFAATVQIQNDLPYPVLIWGRQGSMGWVNAQSTDCFRLPRGWLGVVASVDTGRGTILYRAPADTFITDDTGWHWTVGGDLTKSARCGIAVA
jgi:hypothetical protein